MQDRTRLHDESRLKPKPILQSDDKPKTSRTPGPEKKAPSPFGLRPKTQNQSLAPKRTPERYQTPDPKQSEVREPLPEPGKSLTPKQTQTQPPSGQTTPKPKNEDTEPQKKPTIDTISKGLKKTENKTVGPFDLLVVGVHIVDKVTDDMIEYVKKSHAEATRYFPNLPFLALPFIIVRDGIVDPIMQMKKECEEAKRNGFLCMAAPPLFVPGMRPAKVPKIKVVDLRKPVTKETVEEVFGKSALNKGEKKLEQTASKKLSQDAEKETLSHTKVPTTDPKRQLGPGKDVITDPKRQLGPGKQPKPSKSHQAPVRDPATLQDETALKAAKSGAGECIIVDLGDPRYKGMEKWEYKVKSKAGRVTVVHYVRDPKTGKLMDFKFKKRASEFHFGPKE